MIRLPECLEFLTQQTKLTFFINLGLILIAGVFMFRIVNRWNINWKWEDDEDEEHGKD